MMPIITCGGMRQQFTWKMPPTETVDGISKECDKNFQDIVDRSVHGHITHAKEISPSVPRGGNINL